MGFRFRKRIRIAPGFGINISKSGASLSIGGRGHSLNFGRRGRRVTVGVPGTGVFYTSQTGHKGDQAQAGKAAVPGRFGRVWHWLLLTAVVIVGLLWLLGSMTSP